MRMGKANVTLNLLLAGMAAAYMPAQAAGQSIFQVFPTPNENSNNGLFAISASSPSDIWAVGEAAIHFDGATWTAFPVPDIKGDNIGTLQGVADISPTQAWAVGNVGISPRQEIWNWNGTAWSLFPSPPFTAPGDEALLCAITAISANDIWTVGSLVTDGLGNFLFEHWDGTAWTPITIANNSAFLVGASSDATNDVWAVGYTGALGSDSATLVYHYDGTNWQRVPSPRVGVSDELYAVAALAPNNVWAVGTSIAALHDPTLTLIEHYDGSTWSVVPSPNVGPGSPNQSNRLFGITAVSATDIWAFGSYFAADGSGFQATLLLHWDGTNWTIATSPDPKPGDFLSDVLFAGVVTAPGSVWIVGSEDPATTGKPITATLALHSTTAEPAGPQ
jgi:hypothetical protein